MLLFNFCTVCGSPQNHNNLCEYCQNTIIHPDNVCHQCAEPVSTEDCEQDPDSILCGRCLSNSPYFDHTFFAGLYRPPLSDLLHQFKFNQSPELKNLLAKLFVDQYLKDEKPMPEALISIPLHKKRLRQRGYNQAQLIAKVLSKKFQIPLINSQIIRVKNTIEQSTLKSYQRQKNVRKAFEIKGSFPKHVAIVDDIVTTGSTVNAVAQLLKKRSVTQIDIWAIAKTPQIK